MQTFTQDSLTCQSAVIDERPGGELERSRASLWNTAQTIPASNKYSLLNVKTEQIYCKNVIIYYTKFFWYIDLPTMKIQYQIYIHIHLFTLPQPFSCFSRRSHFFPVIVPYAMQIHVLNYFTDSEITVQEHLQHCYTSTLRWWYTEISTHLTRSFNVSTSVNYKLYHITQLLQWQASNHSPIWHLVLTLKGSLGEEAIVNTTTFHAVQ